MARARGDLTAAKQAYTQDLAISQRLTRLDPDNTGWQRDLAVAYSRAGDVAQDRGDLTAAEQAYTQALAVAQRLTRLDPDNTGWQRDLAVAYGRAGDAAQDRGDLIAAEQAFTQYLAIAQRLTGWIRTIPAGSGTWRSHTARSVTSHRLAAT